MDWFRNSLKPGRLARVNGHKQLTRRPFASCPCVTLLRALFQPGLESSSQSPLPLQTLPPPQMRVSTSYEAPTTPLRPEYWEMCKSMRSSPYYVCLFTIQLQDRQKTEAMQGWGARCGRQGFWIVMGYVFVPASRDLFLVSRHILGLNHKLWLLQECSRPCCVSMSIDRKGGRRVTTFCEPQREGSQNISQYAILLSGWVAGQQAQGSHTGPASPLVTAGGGARWRGEVAYMCYRCGSY